MITHLHGAHVTSESDGYPEAWYLPAADNIPAGYATRGSRFDQIIGATDVEGQAVFEYPNTQRATTLWYHDHTLGMTRANVYAGAAGFYLLRGGEGDKVKSPGGEKAVLPIGDYEIPVLIQDRSFNADGSLFYPGDRAFFEGLAETQLQIPFAPEPAMSGKSDVSPIWNPEFFGNTIVVNGSTWPYLKVEPRQYRFRLLNGSDSRFLILSSEIPIDNDSLPALTFHQIGGDGGFLPQTVALTELLMAPAERADIIIDFSRLAGKTVNLINRGPDEPFGGGTPGIDFEPADTATTGQVLQFRVGNNRRVKDPSTPVAKLRLPAPVEIGTANATRRLSLNELESASLFVPVDENGYIFNGDGNLVEIAADAPHAAPFGPTEARLGTVDDDGNPVAMPWMEQISENPMLGDIEIWEIYNFTMDAHPIHIHQVQFEIINRQVLEKDANGMVMLPVMPADGTERAPEAGETGRKDTVIVYPGEMARVKAVFDLPGLYVWHCHILSHEDNDMMRPFYVGPMPASGM